MATADIARDMDILRAARGRREAHLRGRLLRLDLGQSPTRTCSRSRVRALVVDGVLDPIAWSTGRRRSGDGPVLDPAAQRRRGAGDAERVLPPVRCRRRRCAFGAGHSALRRARRSGCCRQPMTITFPDGTSRCSTTRTSSVQTLGRDVRLVLMARTSPRCSPTSSTRPPPQADRRRARSASAAPSLVHPQARLPALLELRSRASRPWRAPTSDNPDSYEAWWNAGIAADAATDTSDASGPGRRGSAPPGIDTDADRYMGPFNKQHQRTRCSSSATSFDPATPYHGAVTVANLLPNSALLTVHGWGHTSLFLSACADEAITRYLVDLTTPPPGNGVRTEGCGLASARNPTSPPRRHRGAGPHRHRG